MYKLITFHSGEAKISALSFRNLREISSNMRAFVVLRSFMKSGPIVISNIYAGSFLTPENLNIGTY